MHAVERPRTKRSGLSIYLAATFLLLGVLLLPGAARAQWTSLSGNTTTPDNVGIGTASPAAKLDIQAPPTATPLILFRQGSAAGEAVQLGVFNAPGSSGSTIFNAARLMAGTNGVSSAASYIEFQPINTNGSGWASGLSVKAGGFVGVGTASPTAKLQVAGDIMASGTLSSGRTASGVYLWDDGTGGNVGALSGGSNARDLSVQGQNLIFFAGASYAEKMRISSGGNVGIGTSSPQNPLTIARSGSAPYTARPAYELLQLVDKTDNTPQMLFGTAFNGMMLRYTGTDGTATNQRLGVITGGAGEAFVINNNGQVGVGTTNPGTNYKLDVTGNTNVTGALTTTGAITAGGAITGATVNATYQDVAEWVPSSQKLAAGTVVVLDTERANHVLASTAAYDTAVAGVVSERPGISLGEGGEGRVLVATTGRVKVKVDATRAPIKVGDLLVTSDREGVAMKSVPVEVGGRKMHAPGTIIGKALEPLEKGTGEILVLLSLQ